MHEDSDLIILDTVHHMKYVSLEYSQRSSATLCLNSLCSDKRHLFTDIGGIYLAHCASKWFELNFQK